MNCQFLYVNPKIRLCSILGVFKKERIDGGKSSEIIESLFFKICPIFRRFFKTRICYYILLKISMIILLVYFMCFGIHLQVGYGSKFLMF